MKTAAQIKEIRKDGERKRFRPFSHSSFFKKHPPHKLEQKIYYCPVCSKAGKRIRVLTFGEYCKKHAEMKRKVLKRRGYMD